MKKSDKGFKLFRKVNFLRNHHFSKISVTSKNLVLPEATKKELNKLVIGTKNRLSKEEFRGARQSTKFKEGTFALFTGASVADKILAAEVLANELNLDLYRVDLSSGVKYIGETSKNIQKIFDAAEKSGQVLLFDEADALFGKRSEIKDSHDRFHESEVINIFEQFEKFKGIAILMVNSKENIDASIVRRLRYILEFPRPGQGQREPVWKKIFKKK